MVRLYTTFYPEQNPIRNTEIQTALHINILLPEIDRLYILNEGADVSELSNRKTEIISIKCRPTYQDFFNLINKVSQNKDINIIANTDIYFDKNIKVLENISLKDTCLALSRWNEQLNDSVKLFNRNDSQDAWVFKGKIKENVYADFPMGIPFCDNRILYELQQAGYHVLNPSFSIKSYHLHAGVREEYDKSKLKLFVDPPYRYKYPHNMFGLPRTIYFNLTHLQKLAPYRYDIKKINKWWPVRVWRKLLKGLFHMEMRLIGYH